MASALVNSSSILKFDGVPLTASVTIQSDSKVCITVTNVGGAHLGEHIFPIDVQFTIFEADMKAKHGWSEAIFLSDDGIALSKDGFLKEYKRFIMKGMVVSVFSMEDVAMHNNETDCWIVIKGLVLDLGGLGSGGNFLSDHPGGPDVIISHAGSDVTEMFEDIAHSHNARSWANSYIIGLIEGASTESIDSLSLPNVSAYGGSKQEAQPLPLKHVGPMALFLIVAMLVSYFRLRS